jgi:FkbM family methyltransferase
MVERVAAFILAACDDGPMLVARTDVQRAQGTRAEDGIVCGVGACMLETGSHAQPEVDNLLKLSSARRARHPGPFLVLDIGANIGSHTVPWAKFMWGWGSSLSFEAQERLFYALAGNITLNNLFNARCMWAAVAERPGYMQGPTVDYQHGGTSFGSVSMLAEYNVDQPVKGYAEIIPTLSIDSLRLARVDMMKIDVEGMEPQVLRGARQTVERSLPIISAEHPICGKEALLAELPADYRHLEVADNVLCMHRDDPIWDSFKVVEAA